MTRKLGYTGQVLDHDALTQKVIRILDLSYGLTEEDRRLVRVPEYLLLDAGTYRLAVVRTEGVGTNTTTGGLVRIAVDYGSILDSFEVYLAPSVLRQLATSETRDLAEWVRVFGSRLDVNVASWQRWIDGAGE